MLWRKVEKELAEFKSAKPKTALLLTGARQVGKIEYMPIYFAMFLKKDTLPETLTYGNWPLTTGG